MSSFIRQRGTTHTAYWHTIDPTTGDRVQHSKGGFRIKKEAQEHLNEVMGRVQDGTFQKDTKITVRELLVDHWLPTKRTEDLSAATIQHYEETIDHWILRDNIGLGGIRAQSITPKQVTDWRDALAKTVTSGGRAGLSQRTISASVGVLKSAYKWGAINGVIPRDPIANVGRGKMNMSVKANKAWSEDEVRTFLKFSADDRRLHPIWQLAIASGMRREELCGLKWEDVDFDRGTVRIERTRTVVAGKPHDSDLPKTKKSRRTLSLGPVMSQLRSLQNLQKEDKLRAGGSYLDDGWLFANELGVPYYPGMMSTWFSQIVKGCRAALEDDATLREISFHGCRHTCATLMLKAGQPVHVVSRFLGHATVQITLDYYAHVLPGQDESAVVALVAMYS